MTINWCNCGIPWVHQLTSKVRGAQIGVQPGGHDVVLPAPICGRAVHGQHGNAAGEVPRCRGFQAGLGGFSNEDLSWRLIGVGCHGYELQTCNMYVKLFDTCMCAILCNSSMMHVVLYIALFIFTFTHPHKYQSYLAISWRQSSPWSGITGGHLSDISAGATQGTPTVQVPADQWKSHPMACRTRKS